MGETFAQSWSEIEGRAAALPMTVAEHDSRPPAWGRWMTAFELQVADNRGEQ